MIDNDSRVRCCYRIESDGCVANELNSRSNASAQNEVVLDQATVKESDPRVPWRFSAIDVIKRTSHIELWETTPSEAHAGKTVNHSNLAGVVPCANTMEPS